MAILDRKVIEDFLNEEEGVYTRIDLIGNRRGKSVFSGLKGKISLRGNPPIKVFSLVMGKYTTLYFPSKVLRNYIVISNVDISNIEV